MMTAFAKWESGVLVIGNTQVERRYDARVGAALRTYAFINRETGRDYARAGSREFGFAIDGRKLTTDDFALERVETVEDPTAARAVAYLRRAGMAVEVRLEAYAAHPVIRKWLVLRNTGTARLVVRDLDWEVVNLLVATRATAEVWFDYFSRRDKAAVVTMDDCAFLVNDAERQEGFILATQAPGPLKRLEAYAQDEQIAAGYNRDDETVFERILDPGEAFQTAASLILTFAGPIPQDVVDDAFARFCTEELTACDVARVPTVTINTWVPHFRNIERAGLLAQIDRAADMGVDAYQVDDGWYDRMGDWNDDRNKFPNGLAEIADHVRARGMRFGLWMAVATVDEASSVYREHPEWVARDRKGDPNRHPVPHSATMCLDSDYCTFILEKMDGVIARYGVELLKLDLSVSRNLYAPGRYPGCFATNHAHRSHDESHLRLIERLFDLVRTLKQRYPDCLVDLSYEAYGVMDGTDLALTQVADQNWFTNLTSPNEVSFRRELYQRGRVTRPWTLNFGGAVLDAPSAPRYGLFSTLASHALFWGDLTALDDAQVAYYRRWFEWAKAQRTYSDFYRHYRVSDVFPVPDGVSSRDHRHAIPTTRYGIEPAGIHPPGFDPISEHRGDFWDGVARLDERGEGPILLFRPGNSPAAYFQLRIPWVNAGATYRVENATEGREVGVFRGAELNRQGILVYLPEPSTAAVIVLRRI